MFTRKYHKLQPYTAWSCFSLDDGTLSPWRSSDKLVHCHIYFHPDLHSFFTKICNWWWESRTAARSLLQHIPKILGGVKIWTLWVPIHVWKWCLIFPATVILEYARATREVKTNRKTCSFSISRWSADVTFWAHNITDHAPPIQWKALTHFLS